MFISMETQIRCLSACFNEDGVESKYLLLELRERIKRDYEEEEEYVLVEIMKYLG